MRAKVSDFGLSKVQNDTTSSGTHGAIPWMAPEVLEGKPFTGAADVYSFGV
eukprot:CAMPEP_0168532204 /NCGR_PEP_ID=MMETSP0405-20121227/16050_1 /TAXON_ID=498012 /ORGANISM="Trichosphaerium sp, Strain Am-I-7 wt" /LENGTH=50 /DNA_ID=CAMNT_0008557445 /DNA_START=57 /DNA_END=205 /DNA_ORIENTATION=+